MRQAVSIADLMRESANLALSGTSVRAEYAISEELWAADADAGYRFFAGMEPEFIVLKQRADGSVVKAYDEEPDAKTWYHFSGLKHAMGKGELTIGG